jgi:hypothetical protein
MRTLLTSVLGLAISALPTLARAEKPKEFLAVYSNMCVSPNSGDLKGERMIVFRSGHPFEKEKVWVLYQKGEGVLSEPLFEVAEIDGDSFQIDIHFPSPVGYFRKLVGRITADAIEGRYTDPYRSRQLVLKRDLAPENRFPICSDKADE